MFIPLKTGTNVVIDPSGSGAKPLAGYVLECDEQHQSYRVQTYPAPDGDGAEHVIVSKSGSDVSGNDRIGRLCLYDALRKRYVLIIVDWTLAMTTVRTAGRSASADNYLRYGNVSKVHFDFRDNGTKIQVRTHHEAGKPPTGQTFLQQPGEDEINITKQEAWSNVEHGTRVRIEYPDAERDTTHETKFEFMFPMGMYDPNDLHTLPGSPKRKAVRHADRIRAEKEARAARGKEQGEGEEEQGEGEEEPVGGGAEEKSCSSSSSSSSSKQAHKKKKKKKQEEEHVTSPPQSPVKKSPRKAKAVQASPAKSPRKKSELEMLDSPHPELLGDKFPGGKEEDRKTKRKP